jgi:hypothetical protein
MATETKTPIHKHAHPAYGWIALLVCTAVILAVAGWYYLTVSQGYDDEVLATVQSVAVTPKKETSSATTSAPIDITAETTAIDTEVNANATSETDTADTQLDNTILGIR